MTDDFVLTLPRPIREWRRHAMPLALLLLFLLVIYGNSFQASWHFDDFDNIVHNGAVHVQSLSWDELYRSFFGIMNTGRWSRPLSYLSFAVNYRFGGLDVFGYHAVNVAIHGLAAVVLYLLIYRTFQLPLLRKEYAGNARAVALLATLLWAAHPLHVSAVTYIVQRMASMAALFYFAAMLFYLEARLAGRRIAPRILFACGCGLASALSLATKENAAMLPASLFLYEILLVQGFRPERMRTYLAAAVAVCLLILGMGLAYADWTSLTGGYTNFRPFTLWERLLTQPGVILFYLSQLLYPVSSRLMLTHDVTVARSLFDPWTTAAALAGILLLAGAAFALVKRKPLLAFCLFFFLLNHVIEASFLSLELLFEHRNYLPSAFIFVPVALAIVYALRTLKDRGLIFSVFVAAVVAIMIVLGVTVSMQNDVYRDEWSLWSDNAAKAPGLHRPHHNLGVALMMMGRCDEALVEYEKALSAKVSDLISRKYDTYLSMADCSLLLGDDEKALLYMQKAQEWYPRHPEMHRRKAEVMLRRGDPREAERLIQAAIRFKPAAAAYRVTYGRILLALGKPDRAIEEARTALRMQGPVLPSYALLAEAFQAKKDHRMAEHFRKVGSAIAAQWG